MKSPILKKIPGFPDPDQDYTSSILVPAGKNMMSISTKRSSDLQPQMQWSDIRSKTVEGKNEEFLYSIMNSTTHQGDDYQD